MANSGIFSVPASQWVHVCVRNSASRCDVYVNGQNNGTSNVVGVALPDGICNNAADLVIGNTTTHRRDGGSDQQIAEIRFYDYAVSDSEMTSLGNNGYLTAGCYQTNVAGNVFYKNGQAVVSSPLPKYSSASGFFGNSFNLEYRGTHTLYENEVLVRVPKDQFNVTMNPTATYRPVTVGQPCHPSQSNLPSGELRKSLFVSGTLKPYITTIGLYDDQARMLAVGKLSTPVQKLDDVDMNFIVRWDY
jgi:hypothetical protein